MSLLDQLQRQPNDPIINLLIQAQQDHHPNKVDLSVGVFKDEQGDTPVMAAIKQAELRRLQQETSKTYQGIAGDPRLNDVLPAWVFGDALTSSVGAGRICSVQSIGGSAALHIAGRLLRAANSEVTVWLPDPTWGNHVPLLSATGVRLKTYRYADLSSQSIDFSGMCDDLSQVKADDVVLLHGCCHNPSGIDLTLEQWHQLLPIFQKTAATPLVDVAYHGMGQGLQQDSAGWHYLAEHLPSMLIAYSCSKNFGLYRDRIGSLMAIASSNEQAATLQSNMMSITRELYSMPAAHGAFLVSEILSDTTLYQTWSEELDLVRQRISSMRSALTAALKAEIPSVNFDYIAQQKGMFSLFGLNSQQVDCLREDYSIYMLNSSRINIAGLTPDNIAYVAKSVAAVSSI